MLERTARWAVAIERTGRLAEPLAWVILTPLALLALSQVVGVTPWRFVAVLQALTPYLLLPAVPLATVALVRRHWALGVTAGAVVAVLVALSWPLLFPPGQRPAVAAASSLHIVHSNVLFENDRLDDAVETVLAGPGDVLVITEYSLRVRDAFEASPLSAGWPYRIDRPESAPGGTAIWSRYPLISRDPPSTKFATVIADVSLPDGSVVRVAGVHAPTPTHDFGKWRDELTHLAHFADSGVPTVVAGDFNASWWHPDFRDLLSAGFSDAHQAVGAGFSVSWPANTAVPAFVRLDHALVTDQLVVEDVDDFGVPGSDHRAFDVTVRRAAAAG